MLEYEEKLNEVRRKEREVMNKKLEILIKQEVDKDALMNLHNTMYKAYEPSEKDKSMLDEMEK